MEAELTSAQVTWPVFNNLQAFWPGMQVLYGALPDAIKTARAFHTVWKQNEFTPESINLLTGRAVFNQEGYPLRPELAESLWYLSQAFPEDGEWLLYGRDIVRSIQKYCKTV